MSKAEETRNYIIAQAAPIFNMYGYAGTSMSQLTQAINMTKGAIYGNFKDKDEIALAAFDHNHSQVSQKIQKAVRPQKHACDKLIAFANFYLDAYGEYAQIGGCPILNAAVDADDAHPQLKARAAEAIEIWTQSVSRIIYNGIKRHQIHRTVRPEQFASVFVAVIEGGIMMSRTTGNRIHLSRSVDHVIHLVNTELRV